MSKTLHKYNSVLGAIIALTTGSAAYGCDTHQQRQVGISEDAFDFLAAIIDDERQVGYDSREFLSRWHSFYLTNCDLNGDGINEHIINVASSLTCSNGVAACGFVVYTSKPKRRLLLQCQGHVVVALESRTDGWRDIYCGTFGYESWSRRAFVKDRNAYKRSPDLEKIIPPMPWEKKNG